MCGDAWRCVKPPPILASAALALSSDTLEEECGKRACGSITPGLSEALVLWMISEHMQPALEPLLPFESPQDRQVPACPSRRIFGEITDALRHVFGEYSEPNIV